MLTREAINKGLDKTLEEGLLLEAELFGKACDTEDSKEGTKAFLKERLSFRVDEGRRKWKLTRENFRRKV